VNGVYLENSRHSVAVFDVALVMKKQESYRPWIDFR